MSRFMLLQNVAPKGVKSPEEVQDIMAGIRRWRERLEAAGKIIGGTKLADEGGKILSAQNGHTVVVDGPYSETKEVVGGFCFIQADDYAEAVELVRDNPGLRFGSIVIREVDPMGCGSMRVHDEIEEAAESAIQASFSA